MQNSAKYSLSTGVSEPAKQELDIPVPNLPPSSNVSTQQAWFWTATWQAGEREVNAALQQGEYVVFTSPEDLITDLQRSR